jgi:hypothetical protein
MTQYIEAQPIYYEIMLTAYYNASRQLEKFQFFVSLKLQQTGCM